MQEKRIIKITLRSVKFDKIFCVNYKITLYC